VKGLEDPDQLDYETNGYFLRDFYMFLPKELKKQQHSEDRLALTH
jgi:hypothetical protein